MMLWSVIGNKEIKRRKKDLSHELSSYNNDARPTLVVGISSGGVLPKDRTVINNESSSDNKIVSNQESVVAKKTTKLIKVAVDKISKNST
jgi:pyrimidine operon attenuation protein/uracil phosphoribosyltransferase